MNISAVVEAHAESDDVALRHRDEEITYGQLAAAIRRVHAGLAAAGIGPGSRVMVFAGTTPHFVAVLFGILRAGAVAVPVNPLSPAPEMMRELQAISPDLVFSGPASAPTVATCEVACPIVTLPGADIPGATSLDDFVADDRLEPVARTADDLALLLFTSGTAGSPKAAMLTHGNLQSNLDQVDAHAPDLASPADVALGVLPLFHILGINLLLGVIIRSGASVVLVERFDPVTAIELVERHGVTFMSGPPAMWQVLADHPGVQASSFSTVRIAISGAAALPRHVADRVQENLGLSLSQGYGLTEASPVLTLGYGTGAPVTSVGRPIPGVQMRLVDAAGNDVPVGDEGEVLARGANIFVGYLDDPEATGAALDGDGWLHTGDVGVVDDDGFLYIVDRSKDLIVVSGFNVFPGEVEAVLAEHPGVDEAAVVGVPHAVTGEAVKAVVVAVDGAALDEDALIAHCEARLARYKCPQVVEVVTELPRGSAIGKVRRRDLR